jgi:hypothetical protein
LLSRSGFSPVTPRSVVRTSRLELLALQLILIRVFIVRQIHELSWYFELLNMVNHNLSAADRLSVQIVHREHSTSLIFIREEAVAQTLAGLLVSGEPTVHNLAKLTRHNDHVTLVHFVIETLYSDVC